MRALVLSGGGCKGAFQAGVLSVLLGQEQIQYDILAGVSVGALNSGFLAQFKAGEEKVAAGRLVQLWNMIDTDSVYRHWRPFGKLQALWKKSIYDSTPLIELVHSELDVEAIKQSGKLLRIGAVSLDTGQYRAFTEQSNYIADAILASSSFPVMLKPIEIEGELYTDGGLRNVTPLADAIDAGATEIDIVLTKPLKLRSASTSNMKLLRLFSRALDIMMEEIVENDLKLAKLYNDLPPATRKRLEKDVIKIRLFRPRYKLIDNSLDFSQSEIQRMMREGVSIARDVLAGKPL